MREGFKCCVDFKRDAGVVYTCCDGCHFEELHAGITIAYRMRDYHVCCGVIPPINRIKDEPWRN